MGKKLFLVDADKCTSCKLCMIACKDEHVDASYAPWTGPQPETGHFWVDVRPLERGKIPRVKMTYLPVFCQHCEDAPCIAACPEDAIETRADGLVWIDEKACTGCGACEPACPYDVIFMNGDRNVAQKCTGCAHRVDEGLEPRCADVCPHDAILFGEETDAIFAQKSGEKPLEDFHPEFEAAPRVKWRGLPKPWIAGSVVDSDRDEIVAGVEVVATDIGSNESFVTRTDAFGDFWLRELKDSATYRIDIRAAGYVPVAESVSLRGDRDLGTIALKAVR
ncbi:MAG: 4Fe-4S dicluster domain-containing protein [Beijerinckiaceae bacterium]